MMGQYQGYQRHISIYINYHNQIIMKNNPPPPVDVRYNYDFYEVNNYLVEELKTVTNVSRTSFNIWQWTDKDEADQFLTYFTLKYLT